MPVRTSHNSPLRIDAVGAAASGRLGLTLCPGKRCTSLYGSRHGHWERDLHLDLQAISDWGARALVTLVTARELEALQVPSLGEAVRQRGMAWHWLPIVDGGIPDATFEERWPATSAALRERLAAGERVVIHCRGGLGRAGTVAVKLLVDLGMEPEHAMAAVRTVRPGAVENAQQEAYVRQLKPTAVAPSATPSFISGLTLHERVAGGLWGLLVGDALGVPYEFHEPTALPSPGAIEFAPPPGFRRAHGSVPPGTWSDDGAQALALLASLQERGGLDVDDLAQRLLAWYENGDYAVDGIVFDCGMQTRRALRAIAAGTPALECGPRGDRDNGNGSLMRVLPLALWHAATAGGDTAADAPIATLITDAHQQSQITHGNEQAQVCCALYCLWAYELLQGRPTPLEVVAEQLAQHYAAAPKHAAALRSILASEYRAQPYGGGYAVDAFWSAAAALRTGGDYESVVKTVIALGHDTDTTACIAGGLAGICVGAEGIPARWRSALRGAELPQALLSSILLPAPGARALGA